jgi:hypothetical protein
LRNLYHKNSSLLPVDFFRSCYIDSKNFNSRYGKVNLDIYRT